MERPMAVIALITTGKLAYKAKLFSSAKEARISGNGYRVYKDPAAIVADPLNFIEDLRAIAVLGASASRERCAEEIARIVGWSPHLTERDEQMSEHTHTEEKPKKEKVAKETKAPKEKKDGIRGKPSQLAGCKLFLKEELLGKNPRRAGSHGERSLQIIIDNPGITYEEAIASGARAVDIRWDFEKGYVIAEAA